MTSLRPIEEFSQTLEPQAVEKELHFTPQDVALIKTVNPALGNVAELLLSDTLSEDDYQRLKELFDHSYLRGIELDRTLGEFLTVIANNALPLETSKEIIAVLKEMLPLVQKKKEYDLHKMQQKLAERQPEIYREQVKDLEKKYNLLNMELSDMLHALRTFVEENLVVDRRNNRPIRQKDLDAETEILAFLNKMASRSPDQENILAVKVSEGLHRLLEPFEAPLRQLLSIEYRNQLSDPLRQWLVEQFDEWNQQKFFPRGGGLIESYKEDLEYLESQGISEADYQAMLTDFIEAAFDLLEKEQDEVGEFYSPSLAVANGMGLRFIPGSIAVIPGTLTDPFSGKEYEHESVRGVPVSEISIYIDPDGKRNFERFPDLVISGAYKELLRQKLYQAWESQYTLSPEAIIPFWRENAEELAPLLSPRLKAFLGIPESQVAEPIINETAVISPEVSAAHDISMIREVSPLAAEFAERLLAVNTSEQDREFYQELLEQCIFVPFDLDYRTFDQILKLNDNGVLSEEVSSIMLAVLNDLSVACANAREYLTGRILSRHKETVDREGESESENRWLQRNLYGEYGISKRFDNIDRTLIDILMDLTRTVQTTYKLDLKNDRDLTPRDHQLIQNITDFLEEVAALSEESSDDLGVRVSTAFEDFFPEEKPLVSLLSIKTRDKLSPNLREFLVEAFDERYAGKFFPDGGGLIESRQKDIEFLQDLGLDEKLYADLLQEFIEEIIQKLQKADGTFATSTMKLTESIGVRPGSLDNPFGTGSLEHIMINGKSIPEIGIYLDATGQSRFQRLEMAIPGAWQELLRQRLYQDRGSIYTLSPREVIPFWVGNAELLQPIFDNTPGIQNLLRYIQP